MKRNYLKFALDELSIPINIDDWSIVSSLHKPVTNKDHLAKLYLSGIIEMPVSRNKSKKKRIITSPIIHIENRIVTTSSNKKYKLKSINKDYRKFLRINDPKWDWKNPIKI